MALQLTKLRADFVEIFKPCLLEIKSLMRSQLISARRANHKVKVGPPPILIIEYIAE